MEDINQTQQDYQLPLNHEHHLVPEMNSLGMRCNICQIRYDETTGQYYPPAAQESSLIGNDQDGSLL
jgi:hypothetical protein